MSTELIVDDSVSGTIMTAEFVKNLSGSFAGDAALFKVSPPAKYDGIASGVTEYLVVSAATVMFSGPETYIFPGNESGEVLDWIEMDGSFKGGLNHREALEGAGYEVISV